MILMEQHLGDTFEAIIIAVWKDGFTVELVDYFIEGFVPVAEIPDRLLSTRSSDRALTARGGKRRFRLGDRLTVQVARVDKLLRRAYFLPVLDEGTGPTGQQAVEIVGPNALSRFFARCIGSATKRSR